MAKKILLADDSIVIQKVAQLTFAETEYEVITVGDGETAFEKLHEIKPDLVLLDAVMPKLNGYELSSKLKSNPQTQHIPIILITASFEAFDEPRAKEIGIDDFITKPFNSSELVGRVKALLSRTITQDDTAAEAPPPIPAESQEEDVVSMDQMSEPADPVEERQQDPFAVPPLVQEPVREETGYEEPEPTPVPPHEPSAPVAPSRKMPAAHAGAGETVIPDEGKVADPFANPFVEEEPEPPAPAEEIHEIPDEQPVAAPKHEAPINERAAGPDEQVTTESILREKAAEAPGPEISPDEYFEDEEVSQSETPDIVEEQQDQSPVPVVQAEQEPFAFTEESSQPVAAPAGVPKQPPVAADREEITEPSFFEDTPSDTQSEISSEISSEIPDEAPPDTTEPEEVEIAEKPVVSKPAATVTKGQITAYFPKEIPYMYPSHLLVEWKTQASSAMHKSEGVTVNIEYEGFIIEGEPVQNLWVSTVAGTVSRTYYRLIPTSSGVKKLFVVILHDGQQVARIPVSCEVKPTLRDLSYIGTVKPATVELKSKPIT